MKTKNNLVIWILVLLTTTTIVSADPTYDLLLEYGVDGSQLRSMDIGDIDGDGFAEIVTGEGSDGSSPYPSRVRVYDYDGSYHETGGVVFDVQTDLGSNGVFGLAVGDSDNDGVNELVFTNRRGDGNPDPLVLEEVGGLYVYEWTGSDFLQVFHDDSVGDVITVTVGDADNDGLNEVAVSNLYETAIYDYDGATYVKTWSSGSLTAYEAENAIGDIDDDGDNELVISGFTETLILEHDGAGAYTVLQRIPNICYTWGKGSILVADVDDDGDNELLLAEINDGWPKQQQIHVLDYDPVSASYVEAWASGYTDNSAGYLALAVGDVDNMGDDELILGNAIYKQSAGSWVLLHKEPQFYGHPNFVADTDRDGDMEWLSNGNYAGLKVYLLVKTSTDTEAPVITVTGPEDDGVYFVDQGDVYDFSADDEEGQVASFTATVTPMGGSPVEVFDGDSLPSEAGFYTLTVSAEDDSGNAASSVVNFIMVDPSAGFVTGGGWFTSPAGAYACDPELTGKVTFGFVSKYKKCMDVPTGNTQVVLHAGGLSFHSSSYEYLVVSGDTATYKGTGTVNGEGVYGFTLSATDGGPKGDDTLRLRVWDTVTGAVVYDNGFATESGSLLSHGNVIIH